MSSACSPFGKHALEIERGLRHGIAGHDQALDCRIGGYPRRAVDAGCGEDRRRRRRSSPRAQHAQELATDWGT
jgi:hypothetical protein